MKNPKKLWLALLLNLVMDGAGMLYLRQLWRGIVWGAIALIWMNLAILLLVRGSLGYWNVFIPVLSFFTFKVIILADTISVKRRYTDALPKLKFKHGVVFVSAIILGAILLMPLTGQYEAYRLPSSSMENTLRAGESFYANIPFNPSNIVVSQGDVVLLTSPFDSKTQFVKRVVALPGDTVVVIDKRLIVNGIELVFPETAIKSNIILDNSPRDNLSRHIIPSNSFFVVGDNWDNSYDSRFFGPVPIENILGHVETIYWSDDFNRIGVRIE